MEAIRTKNWEEGDQVSFMDEILQQPVALRRFTEQAFAEKELENSLRELMLSRQNPHVVLTGMGSSLFACYIARRLLRNWGYQATAIESFELQNKDKCIFTDDTILIAVSQSGESPEVLELLNQVPSNVPIVSVTNYPHSQLHTMTKFSCGIYAGTEYRTSTKTYTNTLAAMLLLAYRLSGAGEVECRRLRGRLEECADQMNQLILRKEMGEDIAAFISDIEFLICVGSGYSYTTACHSEIVVEEAGKFYSSRFTPAQFIHGPIELIGSSFGVILYDFDRNSSAKCDEVRENVLRYGGKVLLITNRTDIEERQNQMVCVVSHEDPVTAPLLEIIPLELGIDSFCNSRGVAAGRLSRVVKRIAN